MRIVIIPNPDKPDAMKAAHQLMAELRPIASATLLENPVRETLLTLKPDLVIALGGDGSILRVAHAVAGMQTSVVGINFGKLGYLAAFSLEEFRKHLPTILAGKAPVMDRLMLEGLVYQLTADQLPKNPEDLLRDHRPCFSFPALNDIVINAGEPFRMIELHVKIDGHDTATFRGDGLIVSTSSGSTGYNLSAGGPLITPDVHAMVLTPICPHSLSFRSVVLSDSAVIMVHPYHVNPGTSISFDGQTGRKFSKTHCILIRRMPNPIRLVENPGISNWQVLGKKLHWALPPENLS